MLVLPLGTSTCQDKWIFREESLTFRTSSAKYVSENDRPKVYAEVSELSINNPHELISDLAAADITCRNNSMMALI